MYGTRKRREIKALLERGCSQAATARLSGVSIATVKRVARESEYECTLDDRARARLRRVGRPSTVRGFRGLVGRLLKQQPGIKTVEVLRIVRRLGYSGGKSALYALVAELRAENRPAERAFGAELSSSSSAESRTRSDPMSAEPRHSSR